MDSKRLQKIGGVAAILEALIYIIAFIFYGGILAFPKATASTQEEFNFLSENYTTLSILNFISYVLFGILLVILVAAIYERFKSYAPHFAKIIAAFGMIWVVLVIASGMISNIGLHEVVEIGTKDPENAMLIWSSVSIVTEGLGGGNEIVGGIWVLLISILSIKEKLFSIPLSALGIIVGIAGILTVYPLDIFTEIFGISQIVWFLWIGFVMIGKSATPKN
ncbi:hypothetical protein KORDIASMS9_00164 [Kordia sp. SMS9]|uniref:DUF4386 family protein n=1 Tax=Kordia sp. SMS9 TaxID=2282170 RepID=UPI000E0DF136|nr:DUF4386 family protein [Kordia sp. SMS9]AXG67982.1 hypothetical protein KORDIASMS9_00164 [Kordia sp. SMS9]